MNWSFKLVDFSKYRIFTDSLGSFSVRDSMLTTLSLKHFLDG